MAYKTTINKACANREVAIIEIHNQLLAMGWTHVDGICDTYNIPYTDVNTTDNTFTMTGHTYSNSQPVQIRTIGTIPGNLAINTDYYICNVVSGTSFKLSTTYNGSAIDITTQGTGTHTISAANGVYKSNAEASDMPYQYVKLVFNASPTKIYLYSYYYYNPSTKVFSGNAYSSSNVDTSQTGFYLWIHGDKDKVHITTKVASTYYRFWFGFMKPFLPLKTTLSSSATSGSSVILSIADSTGFEVGYQYQIVGVNAEGRDTLTTTEVGISTITVSSLPRNYGIGSIIGINPVPFGHADNTNFNYVNSHLSVGLGSAGYGFGTYNNRFLYAIGSIDPEPRLNKYILQPFGVISCYDNTTSLVGIEAYINTNMLYAPNTNMVIEDTFAVAKLSSGTSSGSNSTIILNDTTKSWATNAYAGKVIIITFGAGSGMIKKIESNTATSISLSGTDWVFDTIPDATSQYVVCEEGYRYIANGTGAGGDAYMALREGY